MPEEMRVDMNRDLSPQGLALAAPLMSEMVKLEQEWVTTGDEGAYQRWRHVVSELQAIAREHHAEKRW